MNIFEHEIFHNNWFIIGLLLMICIPLLIIIINETAYVLQKKSQTFARPLNTLKNVVLPLLAISVVLSQVLEVSRGSTLMKLLETFIWVLIINIAIALINSIFFSGNGKYQVKVPQLFLDIFRVTLVLFGVAIVLSLVWGADLGGLITALGLGSFVIGLALQDTLGNLFSGIALVYEKPFSEGDYIEVEGQTGRVIEMNWRAIRLETREQELIVIPHLVIGQGTIKNYSRPTRVHIMKTEIGFSHANPPNKVKRVLTETCLSTPGILHDPEPEVKTNQYTESKIIYEVEYAIGDFRDHEEIMDEFMSRVWYNARRNKLTMPMGQMMIHQANQITDQEEKDLKQLKTSLTKLPQMLPIEKTNVAELIDGSEIQYFGKGEQVIKQGDHSGSLYVVLEGKAIMEAYINEAEKVTIGELEVGDFFGEITLFTAKFSSFGVTAIEDLKLITIFPDEVMEMVELNPRLAEYLDKMMDARRIKLKELAQQN